MATFLRSRHTLFQPSSSTTSLLTYYWDSTGATTTLLATEALARVRAFWNSLAAPIKSGTVLTHITTVDEIEETTGQIVGQAVGTAPAGVTFTGAGDALPQQTQVLLGLSTGTFINGRRLKGRQFLPAFTIGANTATGGLQGATFAAVNTAAALLGTTVVTPMNQRVWHRPVVATPGGPPASAGLSAIVISRACGPKFSVLRSRRN